MTRAKRQSSGPASGKASSAAGRTRWRPELHPIWLLAGVGFLVGLAIPFALPFDLVPRPPGSERREPKPAQATATTTVPARGPNWEIPTLSKNSAAEGLSHVGAKVAEIRAEPGDGPVIARVLPGTRLQVVGKKKGWVEVRYGLHGAGGWVPSQRIEMGQP